MNYLHLFNRAYALCIKANSHAIAHDLAYMSETELMGVINFLSQIVSWLMGMDRAKRATSKTDAFQLQGARIWLPLEAFHGAAYASLSISAKALLIGLATQLRGNKKQGIVNNGDLTTAIKVLSARGWRSDKTIRKAANELEAAKLITKTRQGHLPNLCNLYAVTWLPLNENDKLDITARGHQLNAYKLLERLPPIKLVANG